MATPATVARPTDISAMAMTAVPPSDFVASRLQQLLRSDGEFRSALPSAAVNEAKMRPELGLAQLMALVMEAYADRPALARRATELVTDPVSGQRTRRLLPQFESLSYRELWSRARALASFWHAEADASLRANDLICILAFAGIDFVTVDLAAIHNGAVVVPMQTNAPLPQLLGIFKEVEPRWLATSLECLPTAVELVLSGPRPAGLLLFDYDPQVDEQRALYEAAQSRLAAHGLDELVLTLPQARMRGAQVSAARLFAEPATDKRLCTIYYTSGSTGLPKGAMYPELMVKPTWRAVSPIPVFYMHYMPMNHSFGRAASSGRSAPAAPATSPPRATSRRCSKTSRWPARPS